MTEALSQPGANRLADRIQAYWARRGHSARVWTEPIKAETSRGQPVKAEVWIVRSDLVNGLPQQARM